MASMVHSLPSHFIFQKIENYFFCKNCIVEKFFFGNLVVDKM